MRTRMIRAIIAGLLGTVALALVAYTAYPFVAGGVPLDIAGMLGAPLGDSWIAGLIAIFVLGTLIAPAFYVGFFHRIVPGGPAIRGMLWGLLLWIVGQAVVTLLTGGSFSRLANDVPVMVGSLVGLLAYGYIFGVIVNRPSQVGWLEEPEAAQDVHVRRAG